MANGENTKRVRGAATRALHSLYEATATYSDDNYGKNRGIAAGTAASFIAMGRDRVGSVGSSNGDKPPSRPVKRGSLDLDYTDEQLEHIKAMASSAEEAQSENKRRGSHFVDRMMEKLLKHAIPDDAPEKAIFEQKLNDPARAHRPNLSIKILLSNFRKLASKMGLFFELQYGIIHLITWKKPAKTLTVGVLYTTICLWPHLVVTYPLIFLLFGIILPGYLQRHPMRTPELAKVKKRGQSLWSYFNSSTESSIVEDYIGDGYFETETIEVRPPTESEDGIESVTAIRSDISSDTASSTDEVAKEAPRYAKSQLALLINMRDLQNLTTDILLALDMGETMWFDTFGFKDERLSTVIFYGVVVATSAVLFLSQFIPWRLIFIQSGWTAIILCHPNSKSYLVKLSAARKARTAQAAVKKVEEEAYGEVKKFDPKDIIVDEAPEKRIVEVFELQTRNILHGKWSFYCYSSNMFDPKNKSRLAGKRPNGVDHLSKVIPPTDWKFDFAYANKWKVDDKPEEFLYERSVSTDLLKVEPGETDGWIYDTVDDDSSSTVEIAYDFRRRRLYRECLRYARPPKQPRRYVI
ncbi:integral peroxisomal membrane peroxin-domain-containing protein [Scheffersomyces xylosifermentans]|uniref:integral peroxisomal membrane peroxin-domain-containing protein n=1 Tax=Scheffersomyces xylosifermentans TaxID=1304137 RepID=UPI00315D4BC5